MAGRIYIGPNTPGGGGLRIMKNPAHDPKTTPRTDYNKFAFDSESGDLAYAWGINASLSGLGYIPILTSAAQFDSGWWEFQGWMTGNYDWGGAYGSSTHTGGIGWSNGSDISVAHRGVVDPAPVPIATKYLLWQLPATSAAVPFAASTGKIPRFYKSGSQLRMPRAGKSASSSTLTDFILHENLRPAKVIAAGRITVASGTTITLEGPTSGNIFVGGHFSPPGASVRMPYHSTVVSPRRVQYRVTNGGRNIEFREIGGNVVDVSYYVVAEDNSSPTSGNASWMRSGVDGDGVSYVQIRRPGCAEPPSFADILVDSRWQVMPMVANGFIPKASFAEIGGGGRKATVSIPTLGYKPLVLVSWQFVGLGVPFFYEGMAAYGTNLGSNQNINQYLGQTGFVEIFDGHLDFINYFENPLGYVLVTFPAPSIEPVAPGFRWNQFTGVRYYVFAIPQG